MSLRQAAASAHIASELTRTEAESVVLPPDPYKAGVSKHPVEWRPGDRELAEEFERAKYRRTSLRSAASRLARLGDELERYARGQL